MTPYKTREAWLADAAINYLLPWITKSSDPIEQKFRVSVGWPGGRGPKGDTVGQCWHKDHSADETWEVFISPALSDPVLVLATLTHELCHVLNENKDGHRGGFVALAKGAGLVKPFTQSNPDSVLDGMLRDVVEELGEYPHAALQTNTGKGSTTHKQTTRMLKLTALGCCDYSVRTTRKWVDKGLPMCPHGTEMEIAS